MLKIILFIVFLRKSQNVLTFSVVNTHIFTKKAVKLYVLRVRYWIDQTGTLCSCQAFR